MDDFSITSIPEVPDHRMDAFHFMRDLDEATWARQAEVLGEEHVLKDARLLRISIHALLVRTGRHTILVDTCFGNHKERGTRPFSRLDTPWLARLAEAGVTPEMVDFVMCTHLHVDHVGWNTQLVDGRWVPTFPNARYVFSRVDHEDVLRDPGRAALMGCYQDSVLPVVEAGQALIVECDYALEEDAVWLEHTPGHSPGHCMVNLKSKRRRAMLAGDLVHHPIQVAHPELSGAADEDPALAHATRRKVLARAAEERCLFIPAHFRTPHAGVVHAAGDEFQWKWSGLA